jgi:hypothetical protein
MVIKRKMGTNLYDLLPFVECKFPYFRPQVTVITAGCICFFLVLFAHFHQSTFVTYGFRPLLFMSETYGCPFGFLADAFPDEVFRRASR